MSAALVVWMAFALALAGAAILFQRMRAAEVARAAASGSLAERAQELEATQKRLDQRAAELRGRGEEISELRKKYEKLKRRAGDEREEEKGAPARIRVLETDLEAERADSRAARDEIVRLHAETERASAELARVSAELGRVTAELARTAGKLAEVTSRADPSALEAQQRRAEASEAKLAKVAPELDAAQRDAAKYKGRWETLDKAYIVLRGELELKKDEARAQRIEVERLRALEVVLVEPEPRREEGAS